MSKWTRFTFATDTHGDMMCLKSVEAFHKFCKVWKPTIRVFGGDGFDLRALRRGATEEEKRDSMLRDYEMGWKFIDAYKPTTYLRGNHCFAAGTEMLTEAGFVPVEEVTMDTTVAQVDEHGHVTYCKPDALHKNGNEHTLLDISGPYTRQVVTQGHDVVVSGRKVKAFRVAALQEKASVVSGCAQSVAPAHTEEDNWVRLLTWVVMDGTVVDHAKYQPNSVKIRVQFKLSLVKKITALTTLLTEMGIPFTHKPATMSVTNVLQPYYIRIYGDAARDIWARLNYVKQLPRIWTRLPEPSLRVFIETLEKTDGSRLPHGLTWVSVERHNMDVVQEWCVLNGIEAAWCIRPPGKKSFANGQPQYHMTLRDHERTRDIIALKVDAVSYAGSVYCVSVPTGRVLVRYQGKTAVTGNCERLWDMAAQDKGVISDYAKKCTNEIETRLAKMRCQMLPYDRRAGVYTLGKLSMVHGFGGGGKTTARTHCHAFGNVLVGHTHAVDHYVSPSITRSFGMTVGCLCDLDMSYMRATIGSLTHSLGWAYGICDEKTGDFRVWQAEKIGDQFIAAGEPLFL